MEKGRSAEIGPERFVIEAQQNHRGQGKPKGKTGGDGNLLVHQLGNGVAQTVDDAL